MKQKLLVLASAFLFVGFAAFGQAKLEWAYCDRS
jgi:hypothetical protein